MSVTTTDLRERTPLLPPSRRECLARAAGRALRRIEAMLALRTHTSARAHTLRREAARQRADLAEIEEMA